MIRIPLLFLSASLIGAEEPSPVSATLRFIDGTSISGAPSSYQGEDLLRWQSPFLKSADAPFRIEAIDRIEFQSSADLPNVANSASVHLNPHYDRFSDSLPAELTSFDENLVTLSTWYAGGLKLRRSMVSSIIVSDDEPPIYRGPKPLKDWTVLDNSDDSWRESEGGIETRGVGAISREFVNLPEKFKLSFRLDADNYSLLSILFMATDASTRPESYYYLDLRASQAELRKYIDRRNIQLGVMQRQRLEFNPDEVNDYEFYVDTKEGILALYANGEQMGYWNDNDPSMPGRYLTLYNRTGREQSISRMTIRPWNGELPEDIPDGSEEDLPGEGERIELRNGDTIVGKASSVDEGKLLVETQFADIAVPVGLLKSFQITSPGDEHYEGPRMWAGDVRAFFHEGGHVTLRLSSITPTSISGYSQVFGEATFDLRAFARIEFNPYDDELRIRRNAAE